MSHPMTGPRFVVSLDAFKRRIDRAFDDVANALDGAINVSHAKRGGIHFVKLGRINLNVSVSKPTVDEPTTVDLGARISRFVK